MARGNRKVRLQEELSALKGVLQQLDIPYRETSRIKTPGGLCLVEGKHLCILKKDLALEKKVERLREQLSAMDLGEVYLKPRVRELLGLEPLDEDAAPETAEPVAAVDTEEQA